MSLTQFPSKLIASSTLGLILAGAATGAQAWTSSSISLLTGSSYVSPDFSGAGNHSEYDATIATFEMANGWAYGDNFFFFDYTNAEGEGDTDTGLYGEFAPRLSFGKITGADLSFGPLTDVLLAGQIEMAPEGGGSRYLYGLGFDLAVPGMDYFQLNTYLRDDKNIPGDTYQVTLVWGTGFEIAETDWLFKGHFDYAGAEGDKEKSINSAPQLLLDVGDFWGASDKLYAGIEYQYWKNKYGVEGADEHHPQLMVTWKL